MKKIIIFLTNIFLVFILTSTVSFVLGASVYEFENLAITNSDGTTNFIQSKSSGNASNGAYFQYNSNAVGEYVTFPISVSAAGTYNLNLQYSLAPARGTFLVEVSDNPNGPYTEIDRMDTTVNSGSSFQTLPMTWAFSSAGPHYLRFRVTGSNPNTGSERMGLDKIEVTPQSGDPTKPNIVMIITDDQGYRDVSYDIPPPDLTTPNIDSLAADGIQFKNFYSNSPVCSPTRASILTGRYSGISGVRGVIRSNLTNSWGYLSPNLKTLPEILQNAGYYTGHIGKWHLGLESPNLPNERGYDYFRGYLDGMMSDYCTHLQGGVDYMRENNQLTNHTGIHATRLFTQWARDFINERAQQERPYFLTLWYNAPHVPIQPPNQNNVSGCPIDQNLPEDRSALVKLIEDLDEQIGVFIQTLKDTGTYNETLIFFASDNGGQLDVGANNGQFRGGKPEVYDGGIRIPMVATWPNEIPSSQASNTVAMTMDLFPTILEAAGVPLPSGIDGLSLLPILKQGGSPSLGRSTIWEQLQRERLSGSNFILNENYALRQGDWKIVKKNPALPNDPNNFELFNLATEQDPYETTDQCATNQLKCIELQGLLTEYTDQAQLVPWRPSVPFLGTPFAAGVLIEAEDFDTYLVNDPLVGAEGAGYHDQEPTNVLDGDYRPAEGVDINESVVASNSFNVGNTEPGEWMAYSVDIVTSGFYRVQTRVASLNAGGTFHIEFNDIDVSGSISVPTTGSWQTWETIETPVFNLTAGLQLMRVIMDTKGPTSDSVSNFDWFKLLPMDVNGP
ncbi:MAG: sulfatase-like hydrolase/transferase, partial [Nitrosomonadaceae bacterium]